MQNGIKNIAYNLLINAGFCALLGGCAGEDAFYASTLKSDIFVQSYAIHSYDFLWIIDNSPSMAPKRQYVADHIQSFISTLISRKAIDYQMAVTDVDYFSNAGKLITTADGKNVVKSKSSMDPAADFSTLVSLISDTPTSFWEQGLLSSYEAITQYGSAFLRKGVPLIVIYVSDDDDWSFKEMLDGSTRPSGIQPENNPDVVLYDAGFFINFFKNLKTPENTDVTVYPLVGTSDANCTVERVGVKYQTVAKALGGVLTPGLCPDSIQNSLNLIATTLADRGVRFILGSPSDGTGLQVYVNSVAVPASKDNGYTFEAESNSILFNGDAIPNNGDVILVVYPQSRGDSL